MGTVGLAVVASIAAYLVGTLITDFFFWALREFGDEFGSSSSFYDDDYGKLARLLHAQEGWVPVSFIRILTSQAMQHLDTTLQDWDQVRSIERMCAQELSPGRRALDDAVEATKRSHAEDSEPTFQLVRRGDQRPIAVFDVQDEFPSEGSKRREYRIPTFSITEDLLNEMSILGTRFNELVPDTGQKIERVRAEAELRFAVALPLTFLVGLFALEESPLWLLGWLVPIALFKAGFALRRQGDRELIEALRARTSEELQRITPVFADFNTAAKDLAAGLRKADWEGAKPSELDPDAVPDYLFR
ncbi:MAG TPA: hypothetical protein VF093_00390 [Solirubrobacterales bacterium]